MPNLFDADGFGTPFSSEIMGYGRELMTNLVKQYPDVPVREIAYALMEAISQQTSLEIGQRFRQKFEAQLAE